MINVSQKDIDEIAKFVNYHLANRYRFLRRDADDIRQNIIVTIVGEKNRYRMNLGGRSTYLNMIVLSELNRCSFQKRWKKHFQGTSLDEMESGLEPLTNDFPNRELNDLERFVFANEFWSIIDTLPEELRTLCHELVVYTKSEVAARRHLKPWELTRKIRKIETLLLDRPEFENNFGEN